MVFGRRKAQEVPEEDPTGWMLVGSIAEFLLMHTKEIKYMAMFGYTFLHGEYDAAQYLAHLTFTCRL